MNPVTKHWGRLCRSLNRRYHVVRMRLHGYQRLGSRYGGWWIKPDMLGDAPLLVDCGLGEDISFPKAFLQRFGGQVVGIEANPKSIEYCKGKTPPGMEVWHRAFWSQPGESISFFVPKDDKYVSGSLIHDHAYVGEEKIEVETTDLGTIMANSGRNACAVLKLDIEGAEYATLSALCESGQIRQVSQLLVEYHHFCTGFTMDDTNASVERVCKAGFELVHVEGRNYIFRNTAAIA